MSDGTKVYGVWSKAEYYGPHLQALYTVRELAEFVAREANLAENLRAPQSDWPRIVIEHEVYGPSVAQTEFEGPCAGCGGYMPCDCADQIPTPREEAP